MAIVPSDLSNLALWLKGDGTLWQESTRSTPATSTNDRVGSWDDASGNSRHALQATAVNRPNLQLSALNGLPVVRCDVIGTPPITLAVASWSLAQPITLFIVSKVRGTPVGNSVLVDGTTSDAMEIRANGTDVTKWDVYAGSFLTQTLPISGAFDILSTVWNGASSKVRQNGTTFASGSAGTASPGGVQLAAQSGFRWLPCDIAEVVLYSDAKGDTDCQRIEYYLDQKYALGAGVTDPDAGSTGVTAVKLAGQPARLAGPGGLAG